MGTALFISALTISARVFVAECTVPMFQPGRVLVKVEQTLELSISVRTEDIAPTRLECLINSFRKEYSGFKRLKVFVFTDPDAAKYYSGAIRVGDMRAPHSVNEARIQDPGWIANKLHAIYSFNAQTHQNSLRLKPTGSDLNKPEDTVLNLPLTHLNTCRVLLKNRCALAMDPIEYPEFAKLSQASGQVTATGIVKKNGAITNITVVNSASSIVGAETGFEAAVVKHLQTWHVDEGSEESFQIVVSFKIDRSIPNGELRTQYGSREITVTINP